LSRVNIAYQFWPDAEPRPGGGNDKGDGAALAKLARNLLLAPVSALKTTFHPRRRVL
jgi:hypothetical protein